MATGAQPQTLPQLPQAHTLRRLADYQALRQLLQGPSKPRVLIVGGGFLGSELAVAINSLPNHPQVTQCFPESGPMSLVLPKYLSEWTGDRLKALGIRVLPRTEIVSAENSDTGYLVKLSNNEEMHADIVIAAIGVKPSIPLHTQSLSSSEGSSISLPPNSGTTSSIPSTSTSEYLQLIGPCFGAGDAVEYWDAQLGMARRTEHYDHAVASGRLAGENMVRYCAGESLLPYTHESMFW